MVATVVVAIMVGALVSTGSRGGYIGFLGAASILAVPLARSFDRKHRVILTVVLVVAAGASFAVRRSPGFYPEAVSGWRRGPAHARPHDIARLGDRHAWSAADADAT